MRRGGWVVVGKEGKLSDFRMGGKVVCGGADAVFERGLGGGFN